MSNNKSDIFSIGKSVVLTGSNWIMFERTFTAYLRIHGLSNYVKPMFVPPPALTELQRAQYAVGIGGTISPPGASSSGKAAETTVTVMSWLRAWAEKRALSTANEASYHQDKQSELERSIHKPLRA
jgi:hypothetical protein